MTGMLTDDDVEAFARRVLRLVPRDKVAVSIYKTPRTLYRTERGVILVAGNRHVRRKVEYEDMLLTDAQLFMRVIDPALFELELKTQK